MRSTAIIFIILFALFVLHLIITPSEEFTIERPFIKASSVLNDDPRLGYRYLIGGGGIWHAQSPPEYPEWVLVAFPEPRRVTMLGIKSQSQSKGGNEHHRAPRDFLFQASHDGMNWKTLLEVKDNIYSAGAQWHRWSFNNKERFKYYRIYILSSNSPDLLTIEELELR